MFRFTSRAPMHLSWLLSAPSPSSLLPHHRPPFSLPPCSPLRTRFFVLFPSRCIPIPGLLSVPSSFCSKFRSKMAFFLFCFCSMDSFLTVWYLSLGFRAIAEAVDKAEGEEFDRKDSDFINVGYICAAHGLEGELRVKPSTDFPELRFSKVNALGLVKDDCFVLLSLIDFSWINFPFLSLLWICNL